MSPAWRLMRAAMPALVLVLAGCGLPDGDPAEVMARTCVSMLERAGRDASGVEPADFAAAIDHYVDGGRPYSTIQPFLRACPLRD